MGISKIHLLFYNSWVLILKQENSGLFSGRIRIHIFLESRIQIRAIPTRIRNPAMSVLYVQDAILYSNLLYKMGQDFLDTQ